jgi:hypothetical protein
MKRLVIASALVLPLVCASALPAAAEVKTREKAQVKIEGFIGKMFNMFGGKAAKEGIESKTAVKGNRKVTISDQSGQIIDRSEEKVYDLDMKKQTYKVTTFDELRRQIREAQEKAAKEAEKEQPGEKPQEKPEKELEVDFDVKETGQKKQVAGYDTREVIMTVTVREKGKALEEGGGLVMTADSWLAPTIAAMKEQVDFDIRYAKALQPDLAGVSREQMAALVAMYPMMKQAIDRLAKEGSKLQGTPLESSTTFEAVKSKEQMAQASESSSSGGGGLTGMLGRKIMKKSEVKQRALLMTMNHQVLEVSTSVAAGELDIPAGFKEKK